MTLNMEESKMIKLKFINISEANFNNRRIMDALNKLKNFNFGHPKHANMLKKSRNLLLID